MSAKTTAQVELTRGQSFDRRAWAHRSGGTATSRRGVACDGAVGRRRPAPRSQRAGDTGEVVGAAPRARGSRSSGSGRSASAGRAGGSGGETPRRRASACGSDCRADSPSTETTTVSSVDGDEPMIGDGDAVGVPREVVQHVARGCRRAAWRRPPTSGDRAIGETRGRRRRWRAAAARPETTRRPLRETPREARRRASRERPGAAPAPAGRSVGRAWIHRVPSGAEPAGGHDAVDVRMMLQASAPTCGGPSARRSRRPGVSGSRRPAAAWPRLARNRRSYTTRLLASASRASGSRHREDDVDVADRQQLLLARRHPRVRAPRSGTSGNADSGSCCTRGPAAHTAHSDRDARRAPPCGTARSRGARADAGP